MINAPVDLANLRSMIDNDRQVEKLLFEEFFISFTDGIKALRANTGINNSTRWRSSAHALKGIAMNLGAMELGELCKMAQDAHLVAVEVKTELLKRIEAEYRLVQEFLQKQM